MDVTNSMSREFQVSVYSRPEGSASGRTCLSKILEVTTSISASNLHRTWKKNRKTIKNDHNFP